MLLVLLYAGLSPAESFAKPWNVRDLGRFYKDHHCISAANMTFRQLSVEHAIGDVRLSDWIAYANGISEEHDAVITCTYGDNRGTRATLVVHSDDRLVDARYLTLRIATIFETHRQSITQEWKDSFR